MNTEDFLDILEQRDLVPPAVLEGIREKVQHGQHRITAKSVLKFLVKKEVITRQQAKRLLDTTLTVAINAESSILGIAPPPRSTEKAPSQRSSLPEEEIPTLKPIETEANENENILAESSALTIGEEETQEELGSFIADSVSASEPFVDDSSEPSGVRQAAPKKKKPKKGRKKKNEWDSPLLLLGGGALVVLLITSVVFGVLLNRENSDAILAEASAFFDGASYTQAINQYERFLENFPRHPQYSTARVKLGMAQLWKATSGATRYADALETAQRVLDEIEDEPDFSQAQRDLATLLPKIAEGLATQAEKAEDAEAVATLLEKTEAALALCANTKFIPKTFRDEVVLDQINQTLQRVERGQQQKTQLGVAVTNIQTAIADRDTAAAYQIHRELLATAPGLINNEILAAQVREISAAEQLEVRFVEEPKSADRTPRPSPIVATLALAQRRGKSAPRSETKLAIRLEGAIYGLSQESGALLWRKFVGFDPDSSPLGLPNGNLLVVDVVHNELLCLAGDTGKLVWRLAFEGPLFRPIASGKQILVAEQSGKLHVIDPANGERTGYVQFSQSLAIPPTVNKQATRIYVVGDQASLFTLSAEDYSCLGVYYLGHEQGGVSTPPVAVLNKVLAAVNTGAETSQLRVLSIDSEGVVAKTATVRRQDGLISTRLLSAGRRVVALTSSGQISVYEVGSATGEESLTLLASRDPESGPPVARFGLLNEGHVWVAGTRLNKLEILPTGNRLPMRNLDNDYLGDTFDSPLQVVDNLLIHVRRPAGKSGAIVAAMNPVTGEALWETELAVSPAGAPGVDLVGKKIVAASSSGATYLLDRKSLVRRVLDQPASPSSLGATTPPLTDSTDLGQGRLAIGASGASVVLHYDPSTPPGTLQAVSLPGPASSAPVLWGDAFVVPTQVGQVFLYDNQSGQQLGSPFQPALTPDTKYDWLTPAIFGDGEQSRLVVCDRAQEIYLVARLSNPQPHLASEASAEVGPSPLVTRLAVVGNLVCAGTADGQLARFQLPTLEASTPLDLGAQIRWGPWVAGDHVLFATDSNELVCLDAQAEIAWRQPGQHGRPTGKPIVVEGSIFVLWQEGGLSRLNPDDGSEAAYVPIDHPVVAGPVPFANRLILSSFDGTLLIVDRP